MMKRLEIAIVCLLIALAAQAQEQQYLRLKGYYRVYQSTDFMLSYFIDGMVEMYVPLDTTAKKATLDRKSVV